jgi:hypothetical protein
MAGGDSISQDQDSQFHDKSGRIRNEERRGIPRAIGIAALILLLAIAVFLGISWQHSRTQLSQAKASLLASKAAEAHAVDKANSDAANLQTELRNTRKALRQARAEASGWEAAADEANAYRMEILSVLQEKGFSVSRSCSGSDIGTVIPEILFPQPGGTVGRRFIVHAYGADPFFCDFTAYMTVDGVVYDQLAPRGRGPMSRRNPLRMRPDPSAKPKRFHQYCFSSSYEYLEVRLPPGPHSLVLHGGCPQGTDVPSVVTQRVSFVVNNR